MRGNLTVSHAYDDTITYLNTNYPNLIINVTDGKYIRFEDKEVEKICATNWGDGIGITITQASVVSSIGTIFRNNTNIVSFNEFNLFTNCKTLSSGSENFGGCTNLKSIDLSNITLLSGVDGYHRGGFENCTSLNNVILNNHLEAIGFMAFDGCTSLENINIPNTVITIYGKAFNSCLNLTSVGDLSNVTKIYWGAFCNCKKITDVNLSNVEYIEANAFVYTSITSVVMPKVKTLSTGTDGYSWGCFRSCKNLLSCDFGEYVESIGWGLLGKCSNLKYIIFRTTTPPTMSTSTFDDTNNCPIYVPDDSVSAYQSATNWSTYSSRIKTLSAFSTDFPNS